jgi:hypothetical protein
VKFATAPQNGTQAHDLSRQLEFEQTGSGRRYPVLGLPSSPSRTSKEKRNV